MDLLDEFTKQAANLHGTVFEFGVTTHAPRSKKRVLIQAGTHGNETGGIGVQLELMKLIAQDPQRFAENEITFAIGNPDAVRAGKRFIERDLNRSFGTASTTTLEDRRAKVVEKYIARNDVMIDLHQTVQPSTRAFIVTSFDIDTFKMIDSLGVDDPILTYRSVFSADGMTGSHYAQTLGKPGFTIEMGALGLDQRQISETLAVVLRALSEPPGEFTPALRARLYTWSETIKQDGQTELVPGLINFSQIRAGQVVAHSGGRAIALTQDSFAVFPKYGALAKTSAEILQTLRPLTAQEITQWSTTP